MFILGNLVKAVAVIVNLALDVYMWIVIARAVLSWINIDPFNPIVRFIHNVTEPVLRQVRSRVPAIEGIDISPMIVFLVILFLKISVVESLFNLAHYLM
jgi:YggT family protein